MKDVILRGIYGTLWCYPMFKLLYWLEDVKLVMIYPWETTIILTGWMTIGWGVYNWIKKSIWLPLPPWGIPYSLIVKLRCGRIFTHRRDK